MAILITSISLAAAGFSFMGLVWGLVAGGAAQAILFCAYRRDPRLFLPCLNDWRNVLGSVSIRAEPSSSPA